MTNNGKILGKIIKQRRLIAGLTVSRLGVISGVSASHLGRIESGERYPSTRILRKIAKPLDIDEDALFTFAGYLSPRLSNVVASFSDGRLDSCVAIMLSHASPEVQHAILSIISALKCMAKDTDLENPGSGNTIAMR